MAKVDGVKVEVNVDTHELDEAIVKAEHLVALLERAKVLQVEVQHERLQDN